MLRHDPDTEALFDDTMLHALPYLIFPPPEFIVRLAGQLDSLWHFYVARHSDTKAQFVKHAESIARLLDEAEDAWDSTTSVKISDFHGQQQGLIDRVVAIDHRLRQLEGGAKPSPVAVKMGRPKKEPADVAGVKSAGIKSAGVKKCRATKQDTEERAQKIYAYLKVHKEMSMADAVELVGAPQPITKTPMKILMDKGLVRFNGKRGDKKGKYILCEEATL